MSRCEISDRQLNTVGAAEITMTNMEALFILLFDLSVLFVPMSILGVFFEGTKIGRHIMDWIMYKLGLDDYDDYED